MTIQFMAFQYRLRKAIGVVQLRSIITAARKLRVSAVMLTHIGSSMGHRAA
jgi:hypothetical protein